MSVKVLSHVWNRSRAKSTNLLVMLTIADCCNDDGFTWYAVTNLAKKARVSPRTLRYAIAALERLGELKVFVRKADDSSRNLSNVYMVVLPGVEQSLPEELRGAIEDTPRTPASEPDKGSLKQKLAPPPASADSTATDSTLPPASADSRSVNNRTVNKEEGADKPRTRTSPDAFRKETVLKHPLWQAYAATFFAPPSFTQRDARIHLEIIEELTKANITPAMLTKYLSHYDDLRKPKFVWLAERIPNIVAGVGGATKEERDLAEYMSRLHIIGEERS